MLVCKEPLMHYKHDRYNYIYRREAASESLYRVLETHEHERYNYIYDEAASDSRELIYRVLDTK